MGGVSYNSDFPEDRRTGSVQYPGPGDGPLAPDGRCDLPCSDKDAFNLSVAYMPEETFDGVSPSLTQTQTGNIFMEQVNRDQLEPPLLIGC